MYTYEAKIIRVVDGDTVECILDLGFHISYRTKVRLAGLNAPELSTSNGPLVKARLEQLLQDPLGVVVQTKSGQFDKYGRVLGVFLKDGKNINQQLIDEKLVAIA